MLMAPGERARRKQQHQAELRDQAQALLDTAREAQHELWDTLSDLESILSELAEVSIEVSSTNDLEGVTVDDLLEKAEEEI